MRNCQPIMISIKYSYVDFSRFSIRIRKLNIQPKHRYSDFFIFDTGNYLNGLFLFEQGLKPVKDILNIVRLLFPNILIFRNEQYVNITVFEP